MSRARLLLAVGVALALGGCAVTRKAEAPKVLRLAPSIPATTALAPSPTLSVAPVLAGGVASQRRYAYVERTAPKEVKQAATLFWDEPPARVLERALVDGLRARFATVAGSETATVADQRVIVRLERFEEQSGGGAPAQAALAFDATVLGARERRIVLAGRYCATAPITGPQPSDRARAFEVALADAVLRFAGDLKLGRVASGGC